MDYTVCYKQIENSRLRTKQANAKVNKMVKDMKRYKKMKKRGYEYQYKFIKLYQGNDPDIECSALTNKYLRCERDVMYTIANLNDDGEGFRYKKNVPLCKNHTKQIVESDDKKTLRYGFYYESDLYFKKN